MIIGLHRVCFLQTAPVFGEENLSFVIGQPIKNGAEASSFHPFEDCVFAFKEITVAMVGGLGMKTIGSTIHRYPTQAEAIRKLGDAYNRTRLTPFVKSLFKKWLAWTR